MGGGKGLGEGTIIFTSSHTESYQAMTLNFFPIIQGRHNWNPAHIDTCMHVQ